MSNGVLTAGHIAEICEGKVISQSHDMAIVRPVLDSRRGSFTPSDLFIAIVGPNHDGHRYIEAAYRAGARSFLVSREVKLPDSNIIQVENTLKAFQALAAYHRRASELQVIGITGSNGKTIVKEWLNQLLVPDRRIVRSPKSFNSQVGVPLSVWNIKEDHTLGIFEAGISEPGEMERLEEIITPEIGVLTNVLSAHAENFDSREEHIREKLRLFTRTQWVVLPGDDDQIIEIAGELNGQLVTWGRNASNSLQIVEVSSIGKKTRLDLKWKGESFETMVPFTDQASVHNAVICIAVLLKMGISIEEVMKRITVIKPVQMRLHMVEGARDTTIINDAYSLDLDSLQIALDFMTRYRKHNKSVVILSDFLEEGGAQQNPYAEVGRLLKLHHVDELVAVGSKSADSTPFDGHRTKFTSTEELIDSGYLGELANCDILIKGARTFRFERVVKILSKKIHATRLEIDLGALANNLNVYRQILPSNVKIMGMVKAFAYGSGSAEIARFLEFNQVDYLGVAYIDEGVALRQAGCSLPIMVMNPDMDNVGRLHNYRLEPEIYSIKLLKELLAVLEAKDIKDFPVHLKLDTGMHRLGFEESDIDSLTGLLENNGQIKVMSVFSHLSGSDDSAHDDFSKEQIALFDKISNAISAQLTNKPLRHIANSAAISRLPEAAFDMVRLGIGLYGSTADPNINSRLEVVSRLVATISQIKGIKAGETIGYGRNYTAPRDMKIATVSVGYADGLPRSLSNGIGNLVVRGSKVPIVGNVCMDMTMIDVTDIPAEEGDEVEVFGQQQRVEELATAANTIPYEIIASISERVTRVYSQE